MNYALIENGQVKTYPYTYAEFRRANPDVSFPRDPGDDRLAEFGIVRVQPTDQPAAPIDKDVVEAAPAKIGDVWMQQWALADALPERVAERQKAAAQDAELGAAKLDAWIVAFLDMTPDQAQTYINNNSATLAALRTNVARLAYAVRVLIRREFNT